ncbi:MAG: zinc dependent phospholipase C family protein [Defluviitaleaceae bacterium]|nr:zinc dependent phospholipase C family protein [Defluviitaleaceae bacterium]
MPGFLTHYIAGNTVLLSVAPEIREKISAERRLYNLGTQGPDIFFYYLPGQIRKRTRGIGTDMHVSGLGLFIAYMARLAKDGQNDTLFAYTAGFLMHYVLDCHAHPYVYARVFDKNAPRIKNSAEHRKLETAIDIEMLKLVSGKKPGGMKQWELINAESDRLSISAAAVSAGIAEVYKRDVPPKIARRAMRYMINFTRLMQSKAGRRKRIIRIAEKITIREPLFSGMIHMQETTGDDYLNIKKTVWQAPWPGAEDCTDSFIERYQAAVTEGISLLEALHDYVYGNLQPAILAEKIGNRSLKTGLQCGG